LQIRNNGTAIAGTAEGGKQINLFGLNTLPANSTNGTYLVDNYFKTVHHEFQHILNQNKPYPSGFRLITGVDYVDDAWSTVYTSAGAAIAKGLITPYAGKEDTEDFAELFSIYVTSTAAQWTARLNVTGSTAAGRTIINTKIYIVKNYMKNEFGIDMDLLRANIQTRITNLPTFDQTTLN
jgi:substrate import-associated zinc metallohydrolase lipoprotein